MCIYLHVFTLSVTCVYIAHYLLSQEGDQETATKMQELALAEGALPRHLHTALFTSSADNRLLTHRQLSRHLVSLWITGNKTSTALMHRILVSNLAQYTVCLACAR